MNPSDPRLWTVFDPNLRIDKYANETMYTVTVTYLPTGMQESCGYYPSMTMNQAAAITKLRRKVGAVSRVPAPEPEPEPEPEPFYPSSITGLTVHLDASTLALGSLTSPWSDLSGGGHHGSIVGTPAPEVVAEAPHGRNTVKFRQDEGRIRGAGMCADGSFPLTVMYVGRLWSSRTGRIFSNAYAAPGYYNVNIGASPATGEPVMYEGVGWIGPTPGFIEGFPTPWRMYGAVCDTGPVSAFYADGILRGTAAFSVGHGSLWNISGYEATGTGETCDCEVSELLTWDRALTDAEREQVEDYLRAKWIDAPA